MGLGVMRTRAGAAGDTAAGRCLGETSTLGWVVVGARE